MNTHWKKKKKKGKNPKKSSPHFAVRVLARCLSIFVENKFHEQSID